MCQLTGCDVAACVWVDDHVRDDVRDWARIRPSPALHADHRAGLTDELIEPALAFAAQMS
jgi:hypothetical protein